MEHAHTSTAHNNILAALLEQGIDLPTVAKRVNMSLAALATWAGEHAPLLADLHQLMVTRCKLLAAQVESAALSALATVSGNLTTSDDARLRERALERCRKAAGAILRHRAFVERSLPASDGSRKTPISSSTHQPHPAPATTSAQGPTPTAKASPKPSLAHRLAARRLAARAAS